MVVIMNKEKSLRKNLFIKLIMLISIPFLILVIFLSSIFQRLRSDYEIEEFVQISKVINDNVELEISHDVQVLDMIDVFVHEYYYRAPENLINLIESYENNDESINKIVFLNQAGDIYESSNTLNIDYGVKMLRNMRNELENDGIEISVLNNKDDPAILFYKEIYHEEKYLGTLYVFSSIGKILESIGNNLKYDEMQYQIYIGNQIYYDSYGGSMDSFISIETEEIFRPASNYVAIKKSVKDMDIKYILLMENVDIYEMLKRNYKTIIAVIFYFILSVVITKVYSEHLIKPIEYLMDSLENVLKKNEFSLNLKSHSIKEYDELFGSFNNMNERIKENYEDIEKQLTIISEKNSILTDMNTRLEASMRKIEESSEKLEYARKRNKALIDNITSLMWRIDTNQRIVFVNDEITKKLGYEVNELIGEPISKVLCPLHEYTGYEDVVSEFYVENFNNIDLWFLNADMETREIFCTSTQKIYENGKLVGIQGVSKLVTEERYLQKEVLSKSEELETLNEISTVLTEFEDLHTLLGLIVNNIEKVIDPISCTIRLLDRHNRLELMAISHGEISQIHDKYIEIEGDNSGVAIKERKIILISGDEINTSRNFQFQNVLGQINEIMYIPLEINNEVIGVLSIATKEELSEFKINVIKLFTKQAGVAIERTKIYSKLKEQYINTIEALASAVEAKDVYTMGHSKRVSKLSKLIAKEMKLDKDFVDNIEQSGLLHDIGKISISDSILTKDGKLSDYEYSEVIKHPSLGEKILRPIGLSSDIIDGVLLHHKRFDLKGYPSNINMRTLPLSARIIGVADAFDAITSDRSYHKAQTVEVALEEIKRNRGTQFCPEVVTTLEKIINYKIEKIEGILDSF